MGFASFLYGREKFAWASAMLLILFFFLVSISQAQVKFGGKASLALTSIAKEGEPFENAKLGWQVGLMGKKYVGDLGWFAMAELLYSKEGSAREEINYLVLPVAMGFDLEETFNFYAGIQYGLVVGGAQAALDRYKNFNWSTNLGFEFYPMEQLIIGSRFNLGLINIIENQDLVGFSRARNSGFSLYFVYLLKD